MGRTAAAIGAINGALAVMAAAFGAHGLEGRVAEGSITARQFGGFETGAKHHLYHAIALVLVGLAHRQAPNGAARPISLAGWIFLIGIVLFSGSLYLYGIFGMTALIWLTPIGGLANIIGWLVLAYGLFRAREGWD